MRYGHLLALSAFQAVSLASPVGFSSAHLNPRPCLSLVHCSSHSRQDSVWAVSWLRERDKEGWPLYPPKAVGLSPGLQAHVASALHLWPPLLVPFPFSGSITHSAVLARTRDHVGSPLSLNHSHWVVRGLGVLSHTGHLFLSSFASGPVQSHLSQDDCISLLLGS
jgi:hypothetical protein